MIFYRKDTKNLIYSLNTKVYFCQSKEKYTLLCGPTE